MIKSIKGLLPLGNSKLGDFTFLSKKIEPSISPKSFPIVLISAGERSFAASIVALDNAISSLKSCNLSKDSFFVLFATSFIKELSKSLLVVKLEFTVLINDSVLENVFPITPRLVGLRDFDTIVEFSLC